MTAPAQILKEALTLRPDQKAKLVDQLLASLNKPGQEIDDLWAKEAESRIDAYERGKIRALSLSEALEKYKQGKK